LKGNKPMNLTSVSKINEIEISKISKINGKLKNVVLKKLERNKWLNLVTY